MNEDNAQLWKAQIEAVTKAALSAPGADQPVPFTAGLLAALLGMDAKAAGFAAALMDEAMQRRGAAGAMPDLSALAETIGAAVERGLDLRVEALRVQLLEELRR